MTYPAFCTTPILFGGLLVTEVDPGTVITDDRTGERVTVDDETAARKGNVVFCTKKVFEALKASSRPVNAGGE